MLSLDGTWAAISKQGEPSGSDPAVTVLLPGSLLGERIGVGQRTGIESALLHWLRLYWLRWLLHE
jgi:hypothetical protein